MSYSAIFMHKKSADIFLCYLSSCSVQKEREKTMKPVCYCQCFRVHSRFEDWNIGSRDCLNESEDEPCPVLSFNVETNTFKTSCNCVKYICKTYFGHCQSTTAFSIVFAVGNEPILPWEEGVSKSGVAEIQLKKRLSYMSFISQSYELKFFMRALYCCRNAAVFLFRQIWARIGEEMQFKLAVSRTGPLQ